MRRLILLGLLSCGGDPTLPELTLESAGEGELMPDEAVVGRDLRRMDIDQLSTSIEMLTGIAWTAGAGIGGLDQFEALSATLGVPDYDQTVLEDREASVVYAKFLGDAASSVCTKLMEKESASVGGDVFLYLATSSDTWEEQPEAIEANIQWQILRFHGRDFEMGSPQLEPWTWLWQTVHLRTGEPLKAWRSVCTALILHPDFSSY